jgi:hypothetical protein
VIEEIRLPDFYLVTGEPEDDWTYARSCHVHGRYQMRHGEYVWVTVHPAVTCFVANIGRIDVKELFLSPRYLGDSLVGKNFPLHVNVYRILNFDVLTEPSFEADDVELLCSAEIHTSAAAARVADVFTEPLDLSYVGRIEAPILGSRPIARVSDKMAAEMARAGMPRH